MYPRGASLTGDGTADEPKCTAVEVREAPGEAVLVVQFDRDPSQYGIPISLTDTDHEYYYTDLPVAGEEEWLESVSIGLMVNLDTGLRARARRRLVDDYIELREEGGWPEDNRFALQEVHPEFQTGVESGLREVGLDARPAARSCDESRLAVWMFAYENNSAGEPTVGQVVVSSTGEASAELEHLEVTAGVPAMVKLDLAYFAAHTAAARGVRTISTTLADPELELIGFQDTRTGVRTLDTSFLGADPDGARALLQEGMNPGCWGQDRDRAGRYLPSTWLGRAWHRLRHGASGARPRIYVG